MIKIIISAIMIITNFSTAEAKLFSNINVSPEEFIACMDNSNDRRCKGHIAMGCTTLCNAPQSTLKTACDTLCKTVKPIAYSTEDKKTELNEERG